MDRDDRAAKVLSTKFGMMSALKPPAIDEVLSGRLHAALDPVDDVFSDALWQRGIISSSIGEALRMARFISVCLPLARTAQDHTGVPASVLLAEAFLRSAGVAAAECNDIFRDGRSFDTLLSAFVSRACALKSDPRFRPVLRAAHDPEKYLAELAEWAKQAHGDDVTYTIDLVHEISTHGLVECDKLHGLNL